MMVATNTLAFKVPRSSTFVLTPTKAAEPRSKTALLASTTVLRTVKLLVEVKALIGPLS